MPNKKKYRSREHIKFSNRSRKRKNRFLDQRYLLLAAGVVVLLSATFLGRALLNRQSAEEQEALAVQQESIPETTMFIESTLSEEELQRQELLREKQAVIESYENLGLVQVAGYLNVRETPGSNGKIIGKLQQNSACEILDTEGEWCHITSGGIEGYIHNRYVIRGPEAREEALAQVGQMAEVNTEKLNIRSEPNKEDATNVVAQALIHERYPVLEELEGWIRIEEGYISADYVTVKYALNEARKLDLRAMALNQYDHLVISKVDSYLNIRSSPSTENDTNIIGKFPGKAAGEILETLDGWYKVKSGPITGYITAESEYVAVGQEARDLALESATLMAIVNTDRLNVRSEPTTSARIWTQISKEDRYMVLDQLDGWVQIELDTGDSEDGESSDKAFIATRDNNVEVRYALTEAIKFSPVEERANQQAALRSKVVNYALQFVGNRYVWGGTNPNTGADCSGFVQYVLRNAAGVSLPRTSREQAKAGRAVTSSEMLPGDLIFYTNSSGVVNHVAMYIGNGQIVHAASRRSGIKISTWNYRRPKTIRRFLN
ncbi:MAG: SH3 domain-containing protein [Lachnospiraceae bacterium]|nr:SH3 domain-containing protein [Lachnospiraceae bacterium]MCI9281985.1 SH3 domain-containing protein [Lachnospiraceae bacterium]